MVNTSGIEEEVGEHPAFTPLLGAVISSMFEHNRVTTTTLIDSLMEQVAEARAREKAVEAGITELFTGPYMPTERAVMSALYPSKAYVDQFREAST